MGAINFDQPSKGTVTSTSIALTVINNDTTATAHCIMGDSKGDGIGVYGKSLTGTAVYGQTGPAGKKNGVKGVSTGDGIGVYGTSSTGTAIYGLALVNGGYGVRAENKADGIGLYAISATGAAIHAKSTGSGYPCRRKYYTIRSCPSHK